MKRLIAAVAALVVASVAHAQEYPTKYRGELKLKKCYHVGGWKDVYHNEYMTGPGGRGGRVGAELTVSCSNEKDMLISHSVRTRDPIDTRVKNSFGATVEASHTYGPDGFPNGIYVETVPVLDWSYVLQVSGICCRYK